MPNITYIDRTGTEYSVELKEGLSVMRGAVDNDVPGIDADCGGECACSTCHVFVDEAWLAKTGTPDEQEERMLSHVAVLKPNSRLACQIKVTKALDGLVVRLPEAQH
jgi:2Fe-2S ferredoxin